ncbi:MAG: histidine phosphatase family protein [Actinomycetota bacterium]
MSTQGQQPTRLVLVRHGESQVTVDRVIGGHRSCSGLSDLGRRQAIALRERLEADPIGADVLLSSTYARAIETAEILRPALAEVADVPRIAGWGEHDPGPEIDGMSFEAYVDRFGTPDWNGDPDAVLFPGGETTRQFHERVHRAVDQVLADHGGCTVVVSCHGGVVDAVFRRLLELPVTGGFELHTLNTSITEFQQADSGRWRLARYNDAAHLAHLPAATPRSDHTAPSGDRSDRIVASGE